MKWLKSAWKWFDGKKRAIGTVLLIASNYVEEPTIKSIMKFTGEVIGALGVVHYVKKDGLPEGLRKAANNIKTLVRK